ncbi:MAG: DsbA family protein [Hyphomicrobiales bacterium]|nr:DsbA family protein [Hyphomicrobiales bacterium]
MTNFTFAAKAVRGAACLALLAMAVAYPASAAETVTAAAFDPLTLPVALPDIVEGSPAAKVTIVEYASVTCTHCAAFHAETWPSLKQRYVDTGRVKFILREFPLDPLSAAGFMLARCAGSEKRDGLIDVMFEQQKSWAFVPKPGEQLLALVKQQGMSQTDFETCLRNQALFDSLNKSRELAAARLDISSTPTFFVNGQKMTGDLPIGEFDKVLTPLLK